MSSTINKTELISKLQTLKGLTNEERSNLIGLLRQKKYGLVWEDKPEDVEERLREELPVLREVKQRAIVSADKDAPNHIIIEGDNLEALTALSYTHEGKIDVIYIDPPYNTGNKDFVYNDSFVDKEDSYRHSKWLSFMNKRLRIAKRLLSDKGVIFISIDEGEFAQLKLLVDNIFLEYNLEGCLIWESTTQPINAGSARFQLQQKTENILFYSKSKNKRDRFILKVDKDNSPSYPHQGKLGRCRFEIIEKSDVGQYQRASMKFNILGQPPRSGKRWQIGLETARKLENENKVEIVDGIVKRAIYPEDEIDKVKFIPFWSFFSANEYGSALSAKEELNTVMGNNIGFDTVKPTKLIRELFSHFHKNSTILDFFAGSGTTLHATMQLNKEDGGHRQCILVTNNENNICEDVTYERNKRVINGYTTPKGVEVEGLKSNTLRYYKTDYISRDRTQKNMRDLVNASTDLLCIKEDLYTEKNKFGRYRVNPRLMRYFSDGKKHMLVVYREEIVDQLAVEIANLDFGNEKLKIYIFSPARYAFNDNFAEVSEKVTLVALPAAIYDAYEKVLPKRKEKLFELVEEARVASETTQDLFSVQEEGGEQ